MPFPVYFSDGAAELLDFLDWLDDYYPRFPRPNLRALLQVPGVATVETLVFLCPSFPLLRPDGFAQLLYLPDVGLFYPTFFPLVWEDRAESQQPYCPPVLHGSAVASLPEDQGPPNCLQTAGASTGQGPQAGGPLHRSP
ncbi:hypothetical protein AMEX_G3959 [Astyanax mexicanus]|uniref:Uncharacterized protein n=1 Tax=Astyanax mexicanus TaxID=7994 RepID=A0A8T2MKA2_ASTMX|nr:hypothetical protein AMEX_G3959 [Astyanax mexicanus]